MTSLLKKPDRGGRPDRAAAAMTRHTIGVFSRRPPRPEISYTSFVSYRWTQTPEQRKSNALKPAWVVRWKVPAKRLPAASPMIMKPSWLMVEYAQTRLMSRLTMAMVEARSMETVPMARNTVMASAEWLKKGNRRANR